MTNSETDIVTDSTPEGSVVEAESSPKSLEDVLSDAYDKGAEPSAPVAEEEVENGQSGDEEGLDIQKPSPTSSVTEPSSVEPPPFWNSKDKEWFKTLPPKTQSAIASREKKRDEAFNSFRSEKQQFESHYGGIDRALEPLKEQLAFSGLSPVQAVQKMAAWQAYLAKDPKKGFTELLASYDLSPEDLIEAEAEVPVESRFKEFETRINGTLERFLSSHEQAQRSQQIGTSIDNFAQEVDSSGTLLRPHFVRLLNEGYLAPIVSSVRASNPGANEKEVLSKAYDIAWAAHPEVREEVLAQRETNRISKLKQEAQRSKTSATPMRGAPGGSVVSHPKRSLEDVLSSKYDEMMNKGF